MIQRSKCNLFSTLSFISLQVLSSNVGAKLPLAYHQHTSLPTEHIGTFLKLCLSDVNFPAFVEAVDKELSILKQESWSKLAYWYWQENEIFFLWDEIKEAFTLARLDIRKEWTIGWYHFQEYSRFSFTGQIMQFVL